MDSFAIAIIAIDEENLQRKQALKIQRKILRDAFNPFDVDDKIFRKNYRVNKAAFKYILEELDQELDPCVFSFSISPISRLAAVLRFLAEGGYQYGVGKDFEVGMAQSTFSTNLKTVLNILEKRLCPLWIKLEMTDAEKREAKLDFYSKASFPGTIMCVDGTHIKIIAPAEEKFLYYNRKGYYSLNAMVICDNKMRIRFIDARYPGSNHDSHVWNLSAARAHFMTKFREGERGTWILGDAGYPLEPWLVTPYRCPEAGSLQSNFNTKHSKTRNMVERVIGVLKNRSRCILSARQLHYSPQKAAQIINVACALHNICIYFMVEDDFERVEPVGEIEEGSEESDEMSNYQNVATQIRDNILSALT